MSDRLDGLLTHTEGEREMTNTNLEGEERQEINSTTDVQL